MPQALDVVKVVQVVVDLGLAVVAIRLWRRQGGIAVAWPAATFVVLGTVVLAASVLPVPTDRALVIWVRKAVVAGLLLFPCFLSRFPEGARPEWWAAFVLVVLVQWSALSVVVAVHLWPPGRDRAALARRRSTFPVGVPG